MSISKIINANDGSGRIFEKNTVAELQFDVKPEVGSFNAVTSDGVARAIAGGGNVPAPSEGDDGKVLTVVDGAAAWADAQGGGASYTAGDGIAITNNEIKVRVKDGGGLAFSESSIGEEDMELVPPVGTVSEEGWKTLADSNGELIRAEYDDKHDVTAITFRYLWNGSDMNPLAIANVAHDDTKSYNAKLHLLMPQPKDYDTEIVATSDTLSDAFTAGWYSWDTQHEEAAIYSLGTPVETTDSGTVYEVSFTVPGEHVGDFRTMAFSASGTDMNDVADVAPSSFLSEDYVFMLSADYVHIVGGETIPGGDLYVEVDQTYNGYSSKPQSGTAVAEAIADVRQVPYGSEYDGGKALVYDDSEGSARWSDQSSASIARDGAALEVRLRNAGGANNSGLAVSTTETPTSITGTVSSGGPNSSYYATFTKAVALDPDADTVNITGFEASIPSGTTTPVYAVVVDGSTWQSGTLTGGVICDRDTDYYPCGIDLANPAPRKAYVVTDPSDQHATSTFFEDVNTFMVFGVSEDNLFYDHGGFYGNFVDEWRNNGLYSALEQYAVAMTQPSGDVEFEIPSRPVETRGIYVKNQLPDSAIADEGKVLTVDNTGSAAWVAGGITSYADITTGTAVLDRDNTVVTSTADITSVTVGADVKQAVVQWTVSSTTTLPTVVDAGSNPLKAASNNPSALTVGKTYQLSILNGCYVIAEFT